MRSITSLSRNKSNSKRFLILSVILLLAIITAILFYTETHHITNFFIKTNSSTPQQKEEATKNDPTIIPSGSAKSDTQPAPGVNNSQTTSQVPISKSSSISITTLNQSSGSVNIAVTITNPSASGVCTVTFTRNGAKPVTRTINTSTNTCGSSIPELEFSMIGDWQVQVVYFANNTQATTTGAITIK